MTYFDIFKNLQKPDTDKEDFFKTKKTNSEKFRIGINYLPNIIATLLQYYLNILFFAIFWQLWEFKSRLLLIYILVFLYFINNISDK